MLDIDRFIGRNQATWQRLEVLTAAARKRRRKGALAEVDIDELVHLYHQVSAHLAHATAAYDDPGVHVRLNQLVADAHAAIYGRAPRAGRSLRRFFLYSFPAAVLGGARFVLVSAACLLLPAIAAAAWLATSETALDVAVPQETQDALLESEFEDYYSSAPAAQFSGRVLVNNIQVSVLAFALGGLAALPAMALLGFNGLNVGMAAGLFISEGQAGKFFGLILPHGLLELSAVIVAGAAGIRIGWALLAPGDRTRAAAMAEEGRRSIVLVLGCTLAFVTAGFVEGFVTPSTLPTPVRVGIGFVVWLAFVVWIVARGRLALSLGFTGLPADDERAWEALGAAAPRRGRDGYSRPVALASR